MNRGRGLPAPNSALAGRVELVALRSYGVSVWEGN